MYQGLATTSHETNTVHYQLFVNKGLISVQPCPFVCILSMATRIKENEAETTWPTKPKILTNWPFTESLLTRCILQEAGNRCFV